METLLLQFTFFLAICVYMILQVYALFTLTRSEINRAEKMILFIVVLFFPVFGSIFYLSWVRPKYNDKKQRAFNPLFKKVA